MTKPTAGSFARCPTPIGAGAGGEAATGAPGYTLMVTQPERATVAIRSTDFMTTE